MSERLGQIGDIERRVEHDTGAELKSAPMWTESDLVRHGRPADVIIVGASEPVTATVLAGLARTRCVVRRGVGLDNVDVAAATRAGIGVAYVPDASVEEVSDHALALLLAVERRLFDVRDAVRAGDPAAAGAAAGRGRRFGELSLGIVGFGRIGRALARKSRGVFGSTLVTDPAWGDFAAAQLGVRLVALEELLATADLISLHAPATPGTRSLIDAERLALVRPDAVIVNTARGELVDEPALLESLAAGRLAGAALDVTRAEPVPPDSPLHRQPGVYLTGHTAAKGRLSSPTLRAAATDAAVRALLGEVPEHLANPEVLTTPNCRLRPPAGALAPEGTAP